MASRALQQTIQIEIPTPTGPLHAAVQASTGFVPVTSIVPVLRQVSEETQALEVQGAEAAGLSVSCRQGCAACCRMLVPVSAPEALALYDAVQSLPADRRTSVTERFEAARMRLREAGLLSRLHAVADATHPLTDEEMDPLNRDYFSLRLACPLLENEVCSVYADRPSACRELLVITPPELCADLPNQPVQSIPVPARVTTALGLLWAELKSEPPKLIPLPLALQWAETHWEDRRLTWKGLDLLERAFGHVSRLLHSYMAAGEPASESTPPPQP